MNIEKCTGSRLCLERIPGTTGTIGNLLAKRTTNEPLLERQALRIIDRSDEELVILVQQGSEAAFSELVKRYMHKSYSIAYQIVGDFEAARDLSQDIFVKIYKSIHRFKQGGKFFSWYYRILINHCINYMRRQKVVAMIPLADVFFRQDELPGVESFDPNRESDLSERQRLIRGAVNKLSSKHRQIMILCELEGFPQEQAAEILGISVGTVRSRLHYARKNLKHLLKQYIDENEL